MKTAKLPRKLGDLIDLAYQAREARLVRQREMDAEIAELKEEEKRVEEAIINGFSKQEIESARGSLAMASIKETTCASLTDFPTLWAWAKKNDALDLFYKRVVSTAYAERTAAGQQIPGVETYIEKKLSLTKNGKGR